MLTECTDERFARQLGDRLRAAVADVDPPAHLTARVHRQYTRRTLLVRATTGVIAAAAVAAAVGAVQVSRDTEADRLGDMAYVRTQMLNALENAKNYVVHASVTTADNGHQESWIDMVTGDERTDDWDRTGARDYSYTKTYSEDGSSMSLLYVYYNDRGWAEWHGPRKPPGRPTLVDKGTWMDALDPESIRAALDSGTLRLLGNDRIDGRAALHLRKDGPVTTNSVFIASVRELWIDAKSFLLRRTKSALGNIPGPATTFDWLPRTAERLAQLKLTPPPGFKKLN